MSPATRADRFGLVGGLGILASFHEMEFLVLGFGEEC